MINQAWTALERLNLRRNATNRANPLFNIVNREVDNWLYKILNVWVYSSKKIQTQSKGQIYYTLPPLNASWWRFCPEVCLCWQRSNLSGAVWCVCDVTHSCGRRWLIRACDVRCVCVPRRALTWCVTWLTWHDSRTRRDSRTFTNVTWLPHPDTQ